MYFGQQAGGVHMGVGYALTENYIQQQGRPHTRRFSEYHIPTVLDMPREFESIAVESAPDPNARSGRLAGARPLSCPPRQPSSAPPTMRRACGSATYQPPPSACGMRCSEEKSTSQQTSEA